MAGGILSIKRKWLKVSLLLMLAFASFAAPMNPQEIEDLLRVMNETRIESSLPEQGRDGMMD